MEVQDDVSLREEFEKWKATNKFKPDASRDEVSKNSFEAGWRLALLSAAREAKKLDE